MLDILRPLVHLHKTELIEMLWEFWNMLPTVEPPKCHWDYTAPAYSYLNSLRSIFQPSVQLTENNLGVFGTKILWLKSFGKHGVYLCCTFSPPTRKRSIAARLMQSFSHSPSNKSLMDKPALSGTEQQEPSGKFMLHCLIGALPPPRSDARDTSPWRTETDTVSKKREGVWVKNADEFYIMRIPLSTKSIPLKLGCSVEQK